MEQPEYKEGGNLWGKGQMMREGWDPNIWAECPMRKDNRCKLDWKVLNEVGRWEIDLDDSSEVWMSYVNGWSLNIQDVTEVESKQKPDLCVVQ